MKILPVALLAAILAGAGPQDEMVDNPDYKGWSNHRPGAWIRFHIRIDHLGTTATEATLTLKELTTHQAVVDQVTFVEIKGIAGKHASPSTLTIPARVKKGTDSLGVSAELKSEGDTVLVSNGREYKCHWVVMYHSKDGQSAVVKTWRCDQVVGGVMIREIRTTESRRDKVQTFGLLDYQGRPAGEVIDNPEYRGWAGQKPGAWVKWKDQSTGKFTTLKLKELTAEEAVLERAESWKDPPSISATRSTNSVPAKIEQGSDAEARRWSRPPRATRSWKSRGPRSSATGWN